MNLKDMHDSLQQIWDAASIMELPGDPDDPDSPASLIRNATYHLGVAVDAIGAALQEIEKG